MGKKKKAKWDEHPEYLGLAAEIGTDLMRGKMSKNSKVLLATLICVILDGDGEEIEALIKKYGKGRSIGDVLPEPLLAGASSLIRRRQ